jgi:hypothetical protein
MLKNPCPRCQSSHTNRTSIGDNRSPVVALGLIFGLVIWPIYPLLVLFIGSQVKVIYSCHNCGYHFPVLIPSKLAPSTRARCIAIAFLLGMAEALLILIYTTRAH